MRRWSAIIILGACTLRASARADSVPVYGYQWATIGDAGNRATAPEEVPDRPELQIGSVGYEYRMTTTEVTVGQWFDFVQAYAPYYEGPATNTAFTGGSIFRIGSNYIITTSNPEQPTSMSWEYAARYCNWLHNGKALTRDAFENGAYDTSTFTFNEDGTANHQATRSPGATFWIPSLDEWTKAAHWDPAKNEGAGGYWLYPGASDVPLIPGPPAHGGQTNAGRTEAGVIGPATVGSYPEINAPWGLLDTSGGISEWLESTDEIKFNGFRDVRGSSRGGMTYELLDRIDFVSDGVIRSPFAGLRLASVVPAPQPAVVFGVVSLFLGLRRTRPCSNLSVVPRYL